MHRWGRCVKAATGWAGCIALVVSLAAAAPPVETSGENLLDNAGFESGIAGRPVAWEAIELPGGDGDVMFDWDEDVFAGGAHAVGIHIEGSGRGIWSQKVPVQGGCVYELSGYVAFRDLSPRSDAHLQVVFRDGIGTLLAFVNLASHAKGSRDFELDFPARMIVRAPDNAVRAEVNGYLENDGSVWFDDLVFCEAPVGTIAGTVTSVGEPLEGARISLWGDPWGATYETTSALDGSYVLRDVPVSHPRYIAIAEKAGFRTEPIGDIDVFANESAIVDFDLSAGEDASDTLQVGYGSIAHALVQDQVEVPDHAPLPADANGYPSWLQPYLESDSCITTSDPAIQALAADILNDVPADDRDNAVAVAWAVFAWISTHINHDAVYGNAEPYLDVTSGIWQTIQPGGWCWGRNLYDWLYRPAELLEERTGICIEHSWLSAALLRALNIPSRARVGSAEFWVSLDGDEGAWFGFSTNGGSNTYRETGFLGAGFGGSALPAYFSASSEPFLQEDWDWQQPGLWHEKHPWGEVYPGDDQGFARARQDLAAYAQTGDAAEGPGRRRPGEGAIEVNYSQIELNLWNLEDQHVIDVRFPGPTDSSGTADTGEWAYWTNHPECVVETYEEILDDSPTGIIQTWRHIVFDVASLLGD